MMQCGVLRKLTELGLKANPRADRYAIARRAALDLTGLPPTPKMLDTFVWDTQPAAFERYVDTLLSSKHAGEHRARFWLDAARYGDTHGMHVDNYREMWPYRDWVVNAFNSNMPFDEFVVEQIAGDMLPAATLEQQIATGFNRCNITTSEGGAIPAELEVHYMVDRDNRYLARGPRVRLDAEVLRDQTLAVSGMLVRRLGGPTVKPYQPAGLWKVVAITGSNTRILEKDSGEARYRRSLYTFWKRTAPPPSMAAFNAPTREQCTVRREQQRCWWPCRWRSSRTGTFPGEGEASDLAFHGRRTVAPGHAGSQAATRQMVRHGSAGVSPQRTAAHDDDRVAVAISDRSDDVSF